MIILFIAHDEINVRANPETPGDTKLDTRFIFNVTQNLSNIIYTSYSNNELRKGRYFGSKGEHDAADYIYTVMNNMGVSL